MPQHIRFQRKPEVHDSSYLALVPIRCQIIVVQLHRNEAVNRTLERQYSETYQKFRAADNFLHHGKNTVWHWSVNWCLAHTRTRGCRCIWFVCEHIRRPSHGKRPGHSYVNGTIPTRNNTWSSFKFQLTRRCHRLCPKAVAQWCCLQISHLL